jgi:hypothetical protein
LWPLDDPERRLLLEAFYIVTPRTHLIGYVGMGALGG